MLLSESVSAGMVVITNGGKLIFKDFGTGQTEPIVLRAKSIQIMSDGEMWIGSRSCRYKGKAVSD